VPQSRHLDKLKMPGVEILGARSLTQALEIALVA
jgi:hypothetical protein